MIPDLDNVRLRAFRFSQKNIHGEIDMSLYTNLLRRIREAGGEVIQGDSQWLNDGSYGITLSYKMPPGSTHDRDVYPD